MTINRKGASSRPETSFADARDQLAEAERLRQEGKLDRAEAICYALTRRYPTYLVAFHTLGLVHLDKGNFDSAVNALTRAVMLNPQSWMTLTALGRAYLRLGATEMAAQTLERASQINPQDSSILVSLAEVHQEEREYERAVEAYRRALMFEPTLDSAAIGLGLCCSATGNYPEAAKIFKDVFDRGNRSLDLFRAIAALPAAIPGIDLLSEIDRLSARQNKTDPEFKNTVAFARARALDLAGRHAESWETLVPANRTLFVKFQEELKSRIAKRNETLAWLRAATIECADDIQDQPISLFIMGPSRSGKTWLERLVGTLPGVKRGYEGAIVERVLRRTFQNAALPTSDSIERLPSSLYPMFGELYARELKLRAGSARIYTNTIAARIHDVARIASAVPNVRFVFLKRDVEDNTLRIYMTKYLQGNSYAYQLDSIRDHLRWYHEMIDVMVEKFPTISRVTNFEAMVEDPAAAVRDVAELCGFDGLLPVLPAQGHDRGRSAYYRNFLASASVI